MHTPQIDSPFAAVGLNPQDFVAIVLCAGLGTRLRPLTKYVSKPTAPIGNMPVAFGTIKSLWDAGIEHVHCNTHYLAEFAEAELLAAANAFGYNPQKIRFWREQELLETGGGIASIVHELARHNLQFKHKSIIVVSGDIWAQIPLLQMLMAWKNRSPNTASLMVTKAVPAARKDGTWVDMSAAEIRGFGPDLSSPPGIDSRMFTTHQILTAREILECPIEKRSSIDMFYRAALRRGQRIVNVNWPPELAWHDIGNYADYLTCLNSLNPLDQAETGAYAVHKHCLIIEKIPLVQEVYDNEKTSKPRESAGVQTFCLALLPEPSTPWCVNRLLTMPRLEGGISFVQKLQTLLSNLSLLLTPTGSYTPGNFSASSLPRPHLQSSLIFALAIPELSLPHPILVPLELLEAPSLADGFLAQNPYRTSRTYFLFIPAHCQQ